MVDRIVDLKKLGISQDLKELKSEKRAKKEGYYDYGYEKEKLRLSKETYKTKNTPPSIMSREQKEAKLEAIKRRKDKIGEEAVLRKQEAKLKERSFSGRVKKGVNRLLEKGYRNLNKRVISRGVIKNSKVTVRIPEYQAPSILGDPNRFFKNEWEETKKSLFFS